jgi:hypothetical protein
LPRFEITGAARRDDLLDGLRIGTTTRQEQTRNSRRIRAFEPVKLARRTNRTAAITYGRAWSEQQFFGYLEFRSARRGPPCDVVRQFPRRIASRCKCIPFCVREPASRFDQALDFQPLKGFAPLAVEHGLHQLQHTATGAYGMVKPEPAFEV